MAAAGAGDDSPGRPAGTARGNRSSERWSRFGGAMLILLSLVLAAGCYAAFALWLPRDTERYADYRAAGACSADEAQLGETDCLSTWRFAVVKTVNKSAGRSSEYSATLTSRGSWQGTVSFGDPGPLLEQLKPGDRVAATVWRRDIVVLSKDGVKQNTSDAPRDELQMTAALGVLAGLIAAQAFLFGAVRLVRPLDNEPFTWRPYGAWVFGTSIAACFGVGLTAVWEGIRWTIVPPVVVAVVVCVAAAMYVALRPRKAV